jgi:hypothetical protein
MEGRDGIITSAKIYLDGKHVGELFNGGNGGGNEYNFFRCEDRKHNEIFAEINDYCNSLWEESDDENDHGFEFSWKGQMMDYVFDEMANEIDRKKQEKSFERKSKTKTIYWLDTDRNGMYHEVNQPYSPRIQAALDEWYPEVNGEYPNGRVVRIFGQELPKKPEVKKPRRKRGPCVLTA